jgi:hypothetical protein
MMVVTKFQTRDNKTSRPLLQALDFFQNEAQS